ncbi:MAG: hypothetical protein LKM38_25310 [Pseudomonas veronii]|nr:hypothetical protein [Pseudomonas veronii]
MPYVYIAATLVDPVIIGLLHESRSSYATVVIRHPSFVRLLPFGRNPPITFEQIFSMGCSGTTDTGPAPIGLAVFSGGRLRFLTPLAALLLFIKPRVGIILTAAIILADVAHNTYYVALNQQWLEPFYLSQVAFLVAVFLLSPIAWNFTRRRVALINTIRL